MAQREQEHDFEIPSRPQPRGGSTTATAASRSERPETPVAPRAASQPTKPAKGAKAPRTVLVAGAPQVPTTAQAFGPVFVLQNQHTRQRRLERLARTEPAVRELMAENAALRAAAA